MTLAPPRRILVVDDNVPLCSSLAMLLRSWGHDVRLAHEGSAAIQEARRFLPDLVLLDVGLPDMDGLQVGDALRHEPALQSALLVSMSAVVQPDADCLIASGIDHHLAKPIEMRFLHSLLGGLS